MIFILTHSKYFVEKVYNYDLYTYIHFHQFKIKRSQKMFTKLVTKIKEFNWT